MASSVFFNGRLYTTPTVASAVNDSAMNPTSATVGNLLAILGISTEGEPSTTIALSGPQDADKLLVSGPLHDACVKAFAAVNDENVQAPATVYAVPVGTATQASGVMYDASGNPVIDLLSTSWGLGGNATYWTVQPGTEDGTVEVTITNGLQSVTADNIGQNCIDLQFLGGNGMLTVGGSVHAGDLASVTLTNSAVSGSPINVTYTVLAGDSLVNICSTLANKLNGNASFSAAGFQAYALTDALLVVETAATLAAGTSTLTSAVTGSGATLTLALTSSGAFTGACTIDVADTYVNVYMSGQLLPQIPILITDTIGNLASKLDAIAGIEATAEITVIQAAAYSTLDFLSGQDIKTAAINITGNLQAVINYLNSAANPFMSGTRTAGGGAPPAPAGPMPLAGGTRTAPMTEDWTAALNFLQTVDVQWITPLTATTAIWAAADAHVQYMSTVGRMERRCTVGPDVGTPISTAEGYGLLLNSDRTSVCWPGYYDFSLTGPTAGELVLQPPYMAAAAVAAGFSGASPGEPMTNKSMTFRGLEVALRDPTDTDPLIQSGILVFKQEPEGYKVVRSISTWLGNNNYNRVEQSCGAATDYMMRTVRNALSVVKGQRGDPGVLQRAVSIAQSALTLLAVPPPEGPGVIVGDANSPAFKNIQATLSGDIVAVQWQASPVIPVNFVLCTAYIQPYSGTATAALQNAA